MTHKISLEEVRRALDSLKVPYQEPEGNMLILRGTANIIEPYHDDCSAWEYYIRATGKVSAPELYVFKTIDELHELIKLYWIPRPYDQYSAEPLPPLEEK